MSGIRHAADVLVVAVRPPETDGFQYNPGGATPLMAGALVVVMGRTSEVQKAARLFRKP